MDFAKTKILVCKFWNSTTGNLAVEKYAFNFEILFYISHILFLNFFLMAN